MANSSPELPEYGVGFILSTFGYHSHAVWAERLVPLGLDRRTLSTRRLLELPGRGTPR
jgi:hypothetical protein